MPGVGSVPDERNSCYVLTWSGNLGRCLKDFGFLLLKDSRGKHPAVKRAAPGWTLALFSSYRVHSSPDLKAYLSWFARASLKPHVEEQSKFLQTLANDLSSFIRVWGLLTYQVCVLMQLRNVGRKGHVLAPTKLGSERFGASQAKTWV